MFRFVIVIAVVAVAAVIEAVSVDEFLRHSSPNRKHLPPGNDLSSDEFHLQVPIRLYGTLYSSIFVNTNGLLSFQTEIPNFFNDEFPLDYPIIAPLYSNIDTRGSGQITYSEIVDDNDDSRQTLAAMETKLREFFSIARDFHVRSVFLVTWLECGYHNNRSDKLNSFQVAIASNGNDSYARLLYAKNGIQWIQSEGSDSGLPDARAQAGFMSGDRRYFTLKGSGSNQVQYLEKWSNANNEGEWLFRIGNLESDGNVESPDLTQGNGNETFAASVTCSQGSLQCHESATCYDFETGFCCRCSSGQYGNGKSCLKNDLPLRVNGKLRGEVNGIRFDDLDVQSYVMMNDGRIYTAVSRIEPEAGFDLQTINLLGEILGWVFARPFESTRNGYDLTGGFFEHRATVRFGGGGGGGGNTTDLFVVEHEFFGLDIFDQLRFEAYVNGTIPKWSSESKMTIFDYDQALYFARDESNDGGSDGGRITMSFGGERSVQLTDQTDQFSYAVEQEISFAICPHDFDFVAMLLKSAWKFKVSRSYVGFEKTDQILRYGMSTKITSVNEIDPCVEGRRHCTANSVCVRDNETYQCVCRPGYQSVENEHEDRLECRDVNECETGYHNCHRDADCANENGSFRCVCKAGFFGNGEQCQEFRDCSSLNCSMNAECFMEADNGPRCYCKNGYTGNGFECEPSPVTTAAADKDFYVQKTCTETNQCTCPVNYFSVDGTQFCQIKMPIIETPLTARPDCRSHYMCDPNAECVYSYQSAVYECRCNEHYTGDGFECRSRTNPATETDCRNGEPCPPFASCLLNETIRAYRCVCNDGFHYADTICQPDTIETGTSDGVAVAIDHTCLSSSDCGPNETCVPVAGKIRNECVCDTGYYRHTGSGMCRVKQMTCGGAVCLPTADCLYDREIDTHYCHCKSELIGDGVHECKPKPVGCNVLNNCSPLATCTFNAYDEYHQCVCNEGYYGNGILCTEIKTCLADPYMCHYQATCTFNAVKQLHECQCNNGFIGNGTVCRPMAVFSGNFLVVNQGMTTLKVSLDNANEIARPMKLHNFQIAVGVSVDCQNGRIYWSDINGKSVQSFDYKGADDRAFVSRDILSPEGLSVDWVSRNVYWTDSKKDTIEVMNIDTRKRKVIVRGSLVNPRGIAVHPQRGKVFWSDWDRTNPKIEWSNMDGSARSVFQSGPSVQLPNALAIDWQTDELCYTDAGTKSIECISIDTRSRQTIVQNLTYPFGLAISDYNYYWNDWITGQIEVIDKRSRKQLDPLKVSLRIKGNKMYGMTVVPNECPRLTNACHFYQCPSSHLCLPNGINSRVCSCADPDTDMATSSASATNESCRDYF